MNISVSLDDKCSLDHGRAFITGIQALIRLPIVQPQRDLTAGLNTAGNISGYPGSPLAAYDLELKRVPKLLEENHIKFGRGVNEDLAATALWGMQQGMLSGQSKYDGVFGIWYGKSPGLDRCGDAFKHVARLYTDGRFQERLDSQFSGIGQLRFHLAPPLLARRDPKTGTLVKREFGPWMGGVLKMLRPLRVLRGSALDPFGRSEERRQERAQIERYRETIEGLLDTLTPARHALAVAIASVPGDIRGFGHVKARHLRQAEKKEADLLVRYHRTQEALTAAE